jgi:5-methylcytosine-specific restriction endonuclease McrA
MVAFSAALALGLGAAPVGARTYHPRTHSSSHKPKVKRSMRAKDLFKHSHPCPSTGKSRGACPGYVIDHIIPLCAGGADVPSNMQWQTAAAAKAKDATERRECEALRKR